MPVMRNAGGYVRVYRSIADWEWYHDDRCVRLFLHLLIKSNWAEGRWKGNPIVPGQLITSSVKLAEQLGWTRSAVVRTLEKLKETGDVDTQSNNHWTLVTIANWDKYQGEEEKSDNRTRNKRTTTGQPMRQPPDTIEEEETLKKGNSEEEKYPFAIWWNLYENKGSKKLAAEQWSKLTDNDREACISRTPAYVRSRPEKNYRKDGERFLKHRTWEDEILSNQPVLNLHGGMTREEAEAEMTAIRIAKGRDPVMGSVFDEECSRALLIYRGVIKAERA